jgi:hypothetical protein
MHQNCPPEENADLMFLEALDLGILAEHGNQRSNPLYYLVE